MADTVITPEIRAAVEKLQYKGFEAISEKLFEGETHQARITVGGAVYRQLGEHLAINPSYSYSDVPLSGWRMDVCVRMSGKGRGDCEVAFCPPRAGKRLRSRQETVLYLEALGLPSHVIGLFDYRTPYCICHGAEDPYLDEPLLECSFGKAGCNGWFHASCAGICLSALKADEQVICPYCTLYLQGIGDFASLDDRRTTNLLPRRHRFPTFACQGKFIIEESAQPHESWGWEVSEAIQVVPPVRQDLGQKKQKIATSSPRSDIYRSGTAVPSSLSSRDKLERVEPVAFSSSGKDNSFPFSDHVLFSFDPSGESEEQSLAPWFLSKDALDQGQCSVEESDSDVSDESQENNDVSFPLSTRVRTATMVDSSGAKTKCKIRLVGGYLHTPRPTTQLSLQSAAPVPILTKSSDCGLGNLVMTLAKQVTDSNHSTTGEILYLRYKRMLIERAVSAAASVNKKRGVEMDNDSLENVSSKLRRLLALKSAGVTQSNAERRNKRVSFDSNIDDGKANERKKHVPDSTMVDPTFFSCGPILCYLPVEDGGLRVCCVSSGKSVAKSIHDLCEEKLICAICLRPFDEKKMVSSSKRKISKQALSFAAFGCVTYSVHESCAWLFCLDSRNAVSMSSDSVTIGSNCLYDEAEDAECDLCGRQGGAMKYFHMASQISVIPAPSSEGWLGHGPCLHWLQRHLRSYGASRQVSCHMERNVPTEQQSEFDAHFSRWRCALCGLQTGYCLRCCGYGCTVRAHPLCVALAGNQWQLSTLRCSVVNDLTDDSTLAFLCQVHSIVK